MPGQAGTEWTVREFVNEQVTSGQLPFPYLNFSDAIW